MEESFTIFCDEQILEWTVTFETLKSYHGRSEHLSVDQEKKEVFNRLLELNLLIVISNLDNLVILKNINKAKVEWEVNFFLKKLILNIYETFTSFDRFKRWINLTLCQNEVEKTEFAKLNSEIKNFKKSCGYENDFKNIRNIIAAHIHSEEFSVYFSTIDLLKPTKYIQYAINFISVLNKINSFSSRQLERWK